MDGDGDDRKLATGVGSRRRAALVVAAAASLAAVAVAGWWATHPSAFDGRGNKVGGPASVGKAVSFPLGIRPRHRIVLREVKPVVSGTARADVTVGICEGGYRGDIRRDCGDLRPVAGYALEPTARFNGDLLVTIVPRSPGTVVIKGSRVRYVDGLQRGVQVDGTDLEFTVS